MNSAIRAELAATEGLRRENERLRELLNNGWLVVNDPSNAFLAADPWSRAIERELGPIKGCMRAPRRVSA